MMSVGPLQPFSPPQTEGRYLRHSRQFDVQRLQQCNGLGGSAEMEFAHPDKAENLRCGEGGGEPRGTQLRMLDAPSSLLSLLSCRGSQAGPVYLEETSLHLCPHAATFPPTGPPCDPMLRPPARCSHWREAAAHPGAAAAHPRLGQGRRSAVGELGAGSPSHNGWSCTGKRPACPARHQSGPCCPEPHVVVV